jgi:hypothetical protein
MGSPDPSRSVTFFNVTEKMKSCGSVAYLLLIKWLAESLKRDRSYEMYAVRKTNGIMTKVSLCNDVTWGLFVNARL